MLAEAHAQRPCGAKIRASGGFHEQVVRPSVAVALFICVGANASAKNRREEHLQRQSSAREAPASASSAQQAIVRLEHRWLNNENNPAVLESILADDFVHVLPSGFISKRDHIAFVRTHAQPHLAEHKFNKLEVRVYGNVAIANGIVVAVPEGGGAPQRTLFTDVFACRKGRWQAVNAQETPERGGK
jgi:hypothetical protein